MAKKHRVWKAKTDSEFLSQLTQIVFIAGFYYGLVVRMWPKITKEMGGFKLDKVAKYGEKDVERLMHSKNMIKNRQKIEATIENAKLLVQLRDEYGSVRKWLDDIKKNSEEGIFHRTPLEDEFRQFKRIGKTTSGWLASLYSQDKEYLDYEI